MVSEQLHERPAELLAQLLRFDTTNPPGGERECIAWAQALLERLGVQVRVLAKEPERPNLLARLSGRGARPPLLLQGHVDVVPARGEWEHPPFAGELAGGYLWGRGALDMKGGVAMMLAAFMRVAAAGPRRRAGDHDTLGDRVAQLGHDAGVVENVFGVRGEQPAARVGDIRLRGD